MYIFIMLNIRWSSDLMSSGNDRLQMNSNYIAGIIFDCDGTLVDSETLAIELLCQLTADQHIDISANEMMQRFRGGKFSQFVAGLQNDYPSLNGELITSRFRNESLPLFRQKLQPMPGACEFIQQLGLPMAVASNGPRAKIETSLISVGLIDYFSTTIVSAYEVKSWKPDPGLIQAAAACLSLPVADCLVVDDSLPGVKAGLTAGAWVAGYGEVDFSSVSKYERFVSVQSYDELKRFITDFTNSL